MLHVRTLGELRLETDDGVALTIRRKPLALLAYVARHGPRATSRTELATLFWGERGEDRARQSLRQTLLELKQAIGDRAEVDAESVGVAANSVELDIAAFEREVASGDLRAAVVHWKGDFFEGSEDIGGDGFRRWIENERLGLHRQLSSAMQRLIGDAEIRGDWAEACSLAERWAGALRFDEMAHLRLIEALRMSGRTAEAATAHSGFATRVRTALDVEPSAEFLRLGGGLAEEVKTELARRGRGSAAMHSSQLSGRGPEFTELVDAWETVSEGTPVVMLIQGEAGSGLTRLCEDFIAHIGAKAVVLRARGKGDATSHSAAAFLFEGVRDAEGSAGASPEALAEVARIVPTLTLQFRHLPAARGDESALRDGLAQTLAAIGEEVPVLVFLDDAHAADGATRQLIGSLATRLSGRVLLLLTADEAYQAPNVDFGPLLETRALRRLHLHSLTASDVETVVGSMVSLAKEDRHRVATLVHDDTGGLPHHVCAVVTALVDDHLLAVDQDGNWRVSPALASRSLPVPASVRDRVRARLERLTPEATAVAGAIAVLGGPSAAAVIEDVSEVSPDAVEIALSELVEHRFLAESAEQAGHYEFASPLAARCVAGLLPPTRRRALHARAAEVLVKRDLAATAERSLLPYHLARADAQPVVSRPRTGPTRWMKWTAIGGAAAAVLAVIVATRTELFRSAVAGDAVNDMPVVALGRISNYREAGSADLTKPLIDMIATNLGRVAGMRVVSTARMYELLNQGKRGDDSAAVVVAAARRAGATELVDGALYSIAGGGMRLDLRRVDLATGSMRKAHSVNGASLFELADSGTARLAADFGQATPIGSIADVTTRSLDAYHLYEKGLRAYYENDKRSAERSFEAALALDSTFAMAAYYSGLSASEGPVSSQRFARAARLSKGITDRERLTILARQASVTSSPTLRALAETLAVRYPQEVEGYLFTGFSLLTSGQFLEALAPFRRVVSMDSLALSGARALCNACDAQRQIVSAYQLADSLDAAERESRRWIRLQPQSPVPWHVLADVLEQRGKMTEAREALQNEAALDPAGIGSARLSTLAIYSIFAGEFEDADRPLRGGIETGTDETRRDALWYLALSYRYQGRLVEALTQAKLYRAASEKLMARTASTPANSAVPQAVIEAQVLFEIGRYRESAALYDSISRWAAADQVASHLARSTAWALTHASAALAAMGDTVGLKVHIDSVQAIGARSGYARDPRLHHHVRGLLLVKRGDDDAAAEEFRRAIYSTNVGYTRTNLELASALMRRRRYPEAIAVLQPALRGLLDASNWYVTRTEIHDLLGQAWEGMPGPAAHDSSLAHYAVVAKSWARADPMFGDRLARARSRVASAK